MQGAKSGKNSSKSHLTNMHLLFHRLKMKLPSWNVQHTDILIFQNQICQKEAGNVRNATTLTTLLGRSVTDRTVVLINRQRKRSLHQKQLMQMIRSVVWYACLVWFWILICLFLLVLCIHVTEQSCYVLKVFIWGFILHLLFSYPCWSACLSSSYLMFLVFFSCINRVVYCSSEY